MIELPPSSSGPVQPTTAEPLSACAVTPVGAPGTTESVGTTAFEAAESGPPPAALTAWTVNVYDVPGVRPVIFFEVGSGEPVTVVGVSDDEPMCGVTL